MADYIEISDTQLDPDAPLTSQLGYQFRDNPEAMFEGSPGASRLALKAIERLVAGDEIRSRFDGASVTTSDNGYLTAHSFAFMQIGTIRASVERIGTGFGTQSVRVRNGVSTVVGGPTAGDTTADVDVIPGDAVLLQLGAFGGGGGTGSCNARFSTDGGNLWPGSAVRLEGNDV